LVYSNQRGFTKYSERLVSTTAVVRMEDVVTTWRLYWLLLRTVGVDVEEERLDKDNERKSKRLGNQWNA
jgi:hypothetical protein